MSVKLLNPEAHEKPIIHRLSHDLESLCMVLIHIVRFSYGPIGTTHGAENSATFRVSQWHQESNVEALEDQKKMDLKAIVEKPERYINGYWAPIIPYIQQLLYLVYPGIITNNMDSTSLTHKAFKDVLIAARDHCSTTPDVSYNYAAYNLSGTSGQKRPRPEDPDDIQAEYPNTRPRPLHVIPFTESVLNTESQLIG